MASPLATSELSRPSPSPTQGACESCYKNKDKCVFNSQNQSCYRCSILQRSCIPRPQKRMGRPPRVKTFSHGSCSILKLSHKPPGRGAISRCPESSYGDLSSLRNQHCNFQPRMDSLSICQREHTKAKEGTPFYQSSLGLFVLKPLGLDHPQFDNILRDSQGFFEIHRYFVLGTSFINDFHNTVRTLFSHSPSIISPAYIAVLQLISHRNLDNTPLDESNLALGSECLKHLTHKSSLVANVKDAATTLLLGQILLVYNTLIHGSSTRVITRGALLHTKKWYPSLMQLPQFESITIAPIVADVTECLVRRELPVLRLPNTDRLVVDRLVGVCSTLLQLLYDLCEQSYAVKMQTPSEDSNHVSVGLYSEIEDKIATWKPPIPPDFFTIYHSSETVLILGQARAYQTAALLIIHRLRFPFGVEDDNGYHLAKSILHELSILSKRPSDGATGLGLDFPLLVALLEMPELGQAVFEEFESLRFRKQQSQQMLAFVRFVKQCYENGYSGLWFDLVDQHLPEMLFP